MNNNSKRKNKKKSIEKKTKSMKNGGRNEASLGGVTEGGGVN